MNTKETYIKLEVQRLIGSFTAFLLLIGGFWIVLLAVLDLLVTPENFSKFLLYRVIAAGLYFILFALIKNIKKYHEVFIIAGTIIVSVMVELMILSFGGHQSPYYAGMIIVFIFLFGLLPVSFKLSGLIAGIIYGLYVLPILIFDNITNARIFINNNMFLFATMFGGLMWRYYNYNLLEKNLSLQYDLDQQKKQLEEQNKQLEVYSLQLQGMVEDRTRELHESEQWHRSLFENATDGIVVLNREGIIMNVSRRACEMHGFSRDALIGAHIRLLEAEDNRDIMMERLRRILGGESIVFETVHNRKDGGKINLEVSSKSISIGNEVYIQSFYRDITEKKKIQEHLFQSQKLESIGVLAGGVAHDFNNILTAILGYTELIRKNSEGNEKVLRSVNIIETAARKSGRMISQLLDFSRKKTHETVPFSLNDVVQDTIRLLERVIDKKVSINELLDSSLPAVRGDVNQMEQVLMNLIVNARDAMPKGGRIMISTGVVEARKGAPDVPPYIPEGKYVLMKVADTGPGISAEIRDKIFEPFFTTKDPGKGTGLGLSMVYGIIREHNGFITMQSAPGEGTTFSIYLPTREAVAKTEDRRAATAKLEGNETVLVVDDEEAVLNHIRETLMIYGYQVISTTDPIEAIEIFKREHQKIRLVITDVAMPTMSGKDLIREIRSLSPVVRVLEISAYGRIVDLTGKGGGAPDAFVQKPFDAHSFASTVRKVIDRGTNRALNN